MDMLDHALRSPRPDGRYAYIAPYYVQAKSVAWDYLKRFAEPVLASSPNESELRVDLINGARISLYGADNFDRLRGLALDGVILDEFADMPANLWGAIVRPALADRKGWATIIGTVKGKNQLWQTFEAAQEEPANWFSSILRASETGILDAEELADAKRAMTAEQFDAEFECDPLAAILGAYFGKELQEAERSGRIASVSTEPSLPIHTVWDLGIGDATAIWAFQVAGSEIRVIDYYENTGQGLKHYAQELDARGHKGGFDFVPHDARVKELGTGRTRIETLKELGRNPRLVPNHKLMDGINAARLTIPRCWFDAERCKDGLEALRQYRADYDEKLRTFKDTPRHDWCFTGDTKVLTRYGTYQIMNLPETGEILTSCGWKPYRNPRVTRKSAPLVAVAFSDGLTVKCTPDHLFKTDSGWKSAEHLQKGSLIQSSLTPSLSILMAVFTVFGQATDICRAAVKSFTEWFGKLLLGPFQKDAIFITETTTRSTTNYPIWNALKFENICPKIGIELKNKSKNISLHPLVSELQNGIDRKRVGFGTSVMQGVLKAGPNGSAKKNNALNAIKRLTRWFANQATAKCIAVSDAKWLTIENVRPLNETADVWCLTVPEVSEFSLSNGAIVHNCSHGADAFRYLAMAWREMVPEAAPDKPKQFGIGPHNEVALNDLWDAVMPPRRTAY